jgi:histidyl-tRNA synthetase
MLNSIGDAACRPVYVELLTAWLDAHPDALDEEARHKRATSPLQVFDVKTPYVRAALADAPKIGDSLCAECRTHFDDVRRYLDGYGVPYTIEPSLVRGLDYYARTTWEFVGPDENANSTISGGGRYDGLVEAVGGPPAPGVGFGAGLERLRLALESEGRLAVPAGLDVFFVLDAGAPRDRVLQSLAEVRRAGLSADIDYAGRSLKGQLTQAGRTGAKTVVIVRAADAAVRAEGAERVVALDDVVATLTA